jgi:hypothetical protein
MAAAKIRDRSIPIAEFEMPLSEVLALLLPPGQVLLGDNWTIYTTGDTVTLTRVREGVPNPWQGQGQGPP